MPSMWTYPPMLTARVHGMMLVGGDLHCWPGKQPTAWRAFCKLSRQLQPAATVLNGDILDNAKVSRHGNLRGSHAPTVAEEAEEAARWIRGLWDGGLRVLTVGNHEERLDDYVANKAPELEDSALTLREVFEGWRLGYALEVNDGVAEVRHRGRHSGIHTARNNALAAGRTTVTNHTHQLTCTPINNRGGRFWGVETGMLAEPDGPQFEYGEGTSNRWNAGFAVLTFGRDGMLRPPELVEEVGGVMWFRGQRV